MTSASKVSVNSMKCVRPFVLIANIAFAENRLPMRHDRGAAFLNPGAAGDLAGGPVGGQHVDIEVVMAGEAHRFQMRRDRFTWGDEPADDGLGPVVDDRHRYPAVVHEFTSAAVEEGLEILAGGEAAERVAGGPPGPPTPRFGSARSRR